MSAAEAGVQPGYEGEHMSRSPHMQREAGETGAPRSFTSRIAGFSFRHKWYVVAAWVLLIVVSGAAASGLNKVLTNDQKDLSNSDSAQATRLIHGRFGDQPFTELVVTRSAVDTVDSPVFQAQVTGLEAQILALPGVTSVASYLDTNDPSMVSKDRHAALTSITLAGKSDVVEKHVALVTLGVKNTCPYSAPVSRTATIMLVPVAPAK